MCIKNILKKFILKWDPDFTKVTPSERSKLEKAKIEIENGEYFSSEEVWKDIDI